MSIGLRNTSRFLQNAMGEVCNTIININKVDADMHLIMPIYTSSEKAPINVSLIMTLSNINEISEFGKGVKLNYNRIVEKAQTSTGEVMFRTYNPDGSVDEFYKDNSDDAPWI